MDHITKLIVEVDDEIPYEYDVKYSDDALILMVRSSVHLFEMPQYCTLSSLTKLQLDGVTVSISAFRDCTLLTRMRMKNVIITDKDIVFSDCLESVTIDNVMLNSCKVNDIVSALPPTVKKLRLENIHKRHDASTENIDGINTLTSLRELYIDTMNVTLPDSLDDLDDLYTLSIYNTHMSSIPYASSLRELSIVECGLTDISIEVLRRMSHLSSIDLSSNSLTGPVLSDLCTISTIGRIDVSNNSICDTLPTPSVMSKLKYLYYLDISFNGNIEGDITNEWIESLPDHVPMIYVVNCKNIKISVHNTHHRHMLKTHYRLLEWID